MLRAAEAGMQAALMAPTETLAEQHYATIERLVHGHLFARQRGHPVGAPIALLTGSTPRASAATCWRGSPPASCGCWSGPTR